jgi:hypothetical protein
MGMAVFATEATRVTEEMFIVPFSNGGKRSNEKPSNKDAACISRQSQPEPSNQMSQTLS